MKIRVAHLLLAAGAAGAIAVVPALAQDQPITRIESSAKATPSKAGTAAHPRGTAITASAELIVAPDVEAPIVTGLDILVGKGLHWNEGKYTSCAKATLDRHGPAGCPRTSIMGSATALGRADTVPARLDVVFLNGGPGTVYAYASLNNPARVRETLTVASTDLKSGPWGHRETVSIPRSLQIVAGVPLQLNRIRMQVGGKSYAKEYVYSTSCPRGGWKYQVTAHYLYDGTGLTTDDRTAGSIACRR